MFMYDATDPNNLPAGGAYAAYVNGEFANLDRVISKFPRSTVYGIDIFGDAWDAARIFDYEEGCIFDPETLLKAVTSREHYRPYTACVYCDRDNLSTVESTLKDVWHTIWLSTLDGTIKTGEKTDTGSLIVATQYKGGKTALYDTSEALEAWLKGAALP